MTRAEGAHIYVRPYKDHAWMDQGACKDLPYEVVDTFFVDDQRPHRPTSYALARQVCSTCPVKPQCLEYGMTEEVGVFGGLGPSERRTLRKQLGIKKPPVTVWGGPANPVSDKAQQKRRSRERAL